MSSATAAGHYLDTNTKELTMLANTKAFSGFAAPDLDKMSEFYGEKLGIETTRDNENLLTLHLAGDRDTLIYAKPDHEPANYTILNFPVDDVEATVDALAQRGVGFEHYEGFEQDEKGIFRGEGPLIAWFKDPAGNILAILEI
jgi:catechol 2,3-dioxygenase-like lactoylglutathione lyase family enzyme